MARKLGVCFIMRVFRIDRGLLHYYFVPIVPTPKSNEGVRVYMPRMHLVGLIFWKCEDNIEVAKKLSLKLAVCTQCLASMNEVQKNHGRIEAYGYRMHKASIINDMMHQVRSHRETGFIYFLSKCTGVLNGRDLEGMCCGWFDSHCGMVRPYSRK